MTEEKILQSALKEFAEYGFEGSRIDRIAKRAGVNKAMIYYHFNCKEKLYERVLRNAVQGMNEYIKNKTNSDIHSVEQLVDMFVYFISYLHSIDINFFRIVMREISSGGKYLKKIFLPHSLIPFLRMFERNAIRLMAENKMAHVNPTYAFFQFVGSAIYFNLLRIVLRNTELYETVFAANYLSEFIKTYQEIMLNGLTPKKEGK
ncbi:MAG: TetR/AcrR family transcriptional regulator [Spirochaetes bacterium]|nr:TetR/AcrR family transcriptional regulator [Spirochaetota bacterium]